VCGGRSGLATAFTRAATAYWLSVYPCLRGDLRHWRDQAKAIPDPVLRQVALNAQRAKLGNIEGSVAFAAFTASSSRVHAVRAMAYYEATLDYLDYLCEMPSVDPIVNGRQLNQALITAVVPGARHADYYAYHSHHSDNGYLCKLVDGCRDAFTSLPSYAVVVDVARRASTRIAIYQSLNHGDAFGSYRGFESWGQDEAQTYRAQFPDKDVRWWEIAASAGSSLVVFALIAAAANPKTQPSDAVAIEHAYFPWIGAVNSLLDSLVDRSEDSEPGQHRLLDYYASLDQAAGRLAFITAEAATRARQLGDGRAHSLTLAAMVSFYLSAPEAHERDMRAMCQPIRDAIGHFDRPTRLVMDTRRAASRLL
jgi:tetraprenyl-beta-curcumene synthase